MQLQKPTYRCKFLMSPAKETQNGGISKMGAYFSLISQPSNSRWVEEYGMMSPSALAGQRLCRTQRGRSLHPGQCPSWQEGRVGLGGGRSYFCNLRRPDSVTRPQTAARGSHK